MQVVALHGFLGSPKDWDSCNVPNLLSIDLHHPSFPLPSKGFHAWSTAFINYIKSLPPNPRILMGYSLGGRLALHAFIQDPSLWESAIFISTHPGLKTPEEKILRLANDESWAKRFQSEPWERLMNDWNAQSVFKDSNIPSRPESSYNRLKLAENLTGWSLGQQQDFASSLHKIKTPYIWAVGEHDTKFINISPTKPQIVQGCGHRIPYDNPGSVNMLITLISSKNLIAGSHVLPKI